MGLNDDEWNKFVISFYRAIQLFVLKVLGHMARHTERLPNQPACLLEETVAFGLCSIQKGMLIFSQLG